MSQIQLFNDQALPPTSLRRFWDRPQARNEFAEAWENGQIDVDALAQQLLAICRRAAAAGKPWAIEALIGQANFLADQLARRNPNFDIDQFERLLLELVEKLRRARRG